MPRTPELELIGPGARVHINPYGVEYGATCTCHWRRRRPTRTQAIEAARIHLTEAHA